MNLTQRQQKTVDLLGIDLKRRSNNGWYTGFSCPNCGRSDKVGVKFNDEPNRKNHVSINCFHGSCGFSGTEYIIFKQLNKLHILFDGEFIGNRETVEIKIRTLEEVLPNIEVPVRHPPFGFKRTYDSVYLNSRGFTKEQYLNVVCGFSQLERRLRNYIIFLTMEEGKNRGYVSRLTLSKEEIEEFTQKNGYEPLRYLNEPVEFGKMLYGIDEITENTKKVILVEGITDKFNVDRLLNTHLSDTVKCLACFGKKVTEEQIIKLWTFGQNIETIVLMFDAETVEESRKYSRILSYWFPEIKVAHLEGNDDPGSINQEQINYIMANLKSPDQYEVSFMPKIKLR